jgi:hypothetical protein
MKTRNDLEAERQKNAEIQRTVGAKKQASIGAAMSDLLVDLLHKQADTLAAKAKIQEKERELQYREQKIAQLEVYLSDGQRQLKDQLEERGIRSMSTVDQANLHREVELKVRRQFSDVEGTIAIQVERLRHQEAAQKIREQQYKVLVRDALEADIREQLVQDTQTRLAEAKVKEAKYERGLAEDELTGGVENSKVFRKQDFLKGYSACYRSEITLYNLRNGRITADSPDLAFMYDPTHPENPHIIGLHIGRMEVAIKDANNVKNLMANAQKSMEQGIASVSASACEPQGLSDTMSHHGCGKTEVDNSGSHSVTMTAEIPDQAPQEEPMRRKVLHNHITDILLTR